MNFQNNSEFTLLDFGCFFCLYVFTNAFLLEAFMYASCVYLCLPFLATKNSDFFLLIIDALSTFLLKKKKLADWIKFNDH